MPQDNSRASSSTTPDSTDQDESGLFIIGTIVGRQRRAFDQKGGGKRYLFTFNVMTSDALHKVERWHDTDRLPDCPLVGTKIRERITLSYFNGKSGTSVRLNLGQASSAESF